MFHSPRLYALRRCGREEEGQSLVETALSMMALLMLIFGVIESSWAIYSNHYVGNVAHEAARYAIVRGASWGTSCDGTGSAGSGYASSKCTANATDIQNFVANDNFGTSITASNVCVEYFSTLPTSASTSCTTSTGTLANSVGDVVQVTITYPFTISIPLIPAITWNMSSTSQMVIAD